MEPKKLQESYAPFRALMETSVILSIGRCPMLMALSPLGSKIAEIYLINYLVFCCRCCEFANLQICEFTVKGRSFMPPVAHIKKHARRGII